MAQVGGGGYAGGGVNNELRTLRAGIEIGDGIVVPGTQVAPVGRPLPQDMDTLSGNPLFALGAIVAVKIAGTPAGTVAVAGATVILKSFTVTLAPLVANIDCPTKAEALFPKVTVPPGRVGGTGVTITVTVAVAAALSVPMLHNTVLFVASRKCPGWRSPKQNSRLTLADSRRKSRHW